MAGSDKHSTLMLKIVIVIVISVLLHQALEEDKALIYFSNKLVFDIGKQLQTLQLITTNIENSFIGLESEVRQRFYSNLLIS